MLRDSSFGETGPRGRVSPKPASGWARPSSLDKAANLPSAETLCTKKAEVSLPADRAVDAEVDLGTNDGGYTLHARLNVSLPGLQPEVARAIVDAAHQICPYSKATRGNIDVEINLV